LNFHSKMIFDQFISCLFVFFLVMLVSINFAFAHEPIFGLGPHVIFKGGVGVEVEIDEDRSSGNQETRRELAIDTEIIYGITSDLAATLVIPGILDKVEKTATEDQSSSGFGDLSLRLKYRFWRRDRPGIQDSAAIILGGKSPTGDGNEKPKLGSGSIDFLFGLAVARESRRWYYFGDFRYRLNTEADQFKAGDKIFADAAIGIRPWLTEYLEPDWVFLVEMNWETQQRNELFGQDVSNSGGDRLFISPAFFLTYRNWAVKGGVQVPVYQNLYGNQPEVDYRFALAMEYHF
jgi:outer membrane putative beta-barrel porin/alpha-amylase